MIYIHRYDSPLGEMTMASDGAALTGLWFVGQKYFPKLPKENGRAEALPVFSETARWLDLYFGGMQPDFTPRLAFHASPFRLSVWQLLLQIPYGRTTTYGQIAQKLAGEGKSAGVSAQAVGGAVGHNPISLIVPCHRVVGANGSLTGYAGGIDKKQKLLALEKADTQNRFLL